MKYTPAVKSDSRGVSPSPRRAWIEMSLIRCANGVPRSPSPRRAWIEIEEMRKAAEDNESPSPRRAWIEMPGISWIILGWTSRPPHGGRGLKSGRLSAGQRFSRRPPHGGRGLKCARQTCRARQNCRPPHGGRGLKWAVLRSSSTSPGVALPTEGVD